MKIAVAQMGPVTGDLEGNTDRIVEFIRRARRRDCDLIVTPETAITGYMSCDLLEVPEYVRRNKELLMTRIRPEVVGLAAAVGFVDYEEAGGSGAKLYNAAALIQDAEILGVAHKRNLCRYRFFDETRYFVPGRETIVREVRVGESSVRVSPIICEDLWEEAYPVSPYTEAAEAGAELVVVLNASPFESGKWELRTRLIRQHQDRHPLPIVYANTTGIGDDLKDIILFDGRSMVFDGGGEMVNCAPMFEEQLSVVELDEELRGEPSGGTAGDVTEELHQALTFGLREYCAQSGFDEVVIGVSGGVDSALCAALAADALGPDRVLGVSMPSRHSSQETRSDAEKLCSGLGVRYREFPIEDLYGAILDRFEDRIGIERSVTRENFQARLRGLLLMGISNETDRMVVATGNKTELGLGYCTLYGDMVGGMLLIGDLNKMQVYELARHLNERVLDNPIPASVLERVPTAELADEQEDPFDYPVVAPLIDDIIARHGPEHLVERFRARALGEGYPEDVYERYDEESFREVLTDTYNRYRHSAFKRAQCSPIVIVSGRALGFDLRETIINRWG